MKKLKEFDWLDKQFWAVIVILVFAFVFGCSISGCSSLNKSKSSYKYDSSHVVKEKVDSVANKDSLTVHKQETVTVVKSDSSKQKEHTVIEEETVIKEFDSSGKVTKETTTKKKTEKKKDNSSGKGEITTKHSQSDSSSFKESTSVSKQKSDSSKTVASGSTKTVKRCGWGSIWWVIVIAVLSYAAFCPESFGRMIGGIWGLIKSVWARV